MDDNEGEAVGQEIETHTRVLKNRRQQAAPHGSLYLALGVRHLCTRDRPSPTLPRRGGVDFRERVLKA
jgi:hypothetical protein